MSNIVATALEVILSNEQSTIDRLKEILDKESHALVQNDIDSVEDNAKRKKSLLTQFQNQVQIRLDYLSAHDFEASEQGLDQLLVSLNSPKESPIHSQWLKIKTDFHSLIKQNEQNGIVIHHSRHRARALLNILHGGKNQPNLYNESGSAKGSRQHHRLGEA
mgnify:CR=1 FL=1